MHPSSTHAHTLTSVSAHATHMQISPHATHIHTPVYPSTYLSSLHIHIHLSLHIATQCLPPHPPQFSQIQPVSLHTHTLVPQSTPILQSPHEHTHTHHSLPPHTSPSLHPHIHIPISTHTPVSFYTHMPLFPQLSTSPIYPLCTPTH